MSWRNYLYMARPDHWFKNVFMLPGFVIALVFTGLPLGQAWRSLLIGLGAACLIASANYVINEWLDAKFDRFHPLKKKRPAVQADVRPGWICVEYLVLLIAGLCLAAWVSAPFFVSAAVFAVMGGVYNVRPFRTKDRAYLDVLSESVNNPIRLMLGWFVVTADPLPPSSLLLGYWMGGAYLMGMKRFAEYRFIQDANRAGLYRQSFKHYTEESLLISSFFYAVCSAFFTGVFLVKYRIEFIVLLPFLAILFAWYTRLGLRKNSPVQCPENLFREKSLMIYTLGLMLLFIVLATMEMPWLHGLLKNAFLIQSEF